MAGFDFGGFNHRADLLSSEDSSSRDSQRGSGRHPVFFWRIWILSVLTAIRHSGEGFGSGGKISTISPACTVRVAVVNQRVREHHNLDDISAAGAATAFPACEPLVKSTTIRANICLGPGFIDSLILVASNRSTLTDIKSPTPSGKSLGGDL